jgi:branched-chain amino acid transport system ATP-binding protein
LADSAKPGGARANVVDASRTCVLHAHRLETGYRKRQVLDGVSFSLERNQILAVIGHNGAGKSTLLRAVFGMIDLWGGSVWVDGQTITSPRPRQMLARGMAFCPQGNSVFGSLTVRENLHVSAKFVHERKARREGIERTMTEFPNLKPRLDQVAGTLSGGEKQILALGMMLVQGPRILLLDEPSLGLAPALGRQTLEYVRQVCRTHGASVIVVEQKVRDVLQIADRVLALRMGGVVYDDAASALRDDEELLRSVYL